MVCTSNVPLEVHQKFPVKSDWSYYRYMFVPTAGYLRRDFRYMEQILGALGMEMPNLVGRRANGKKLYGS